MWMLSAFVESLVIFWLTERSVRIASRYGSSISVYEFGTYVLTAVTLCATVRMMVHQNMWKWWQGLWVFLSVASWFVFTLIAGEFIEGPGAETLQFYENYGVMKQLLAGTNTGPGHCCGWILVWVVWTIITVVCIFTLFAKKAWNRMSNPTIYHLMQEVELFGGGHEGLAHACREMYGPLPGVEDGAWSDADRLDSPTGQPMSPRPSNMVEHSASGISFDHDSTLSESYMASTHAKDGEYRSKVNAESSTGVHQGLVVAGLVSLAATKFKRGNAQRSSSGRLVEGDGAPSGVQ